MAKKKAVVRRRAVRRREPKVKMDKRFLFLYGTENQLCSFDEFSILRATKAEAVKDAVNYRESDSYGRGESLYVVQVVATDRLPIEKQVSPLYDVED